MLGHKSGVQRIAFLVLLPSLAALAQQGPCQVIVSVTDNYGHPVEADQVRMTTDGVVTEVPQDKTFQARCGPHTLHVELRGFDLANMHIDVTQVEQVLKVAMRLGAVDAPVPDCAIMGRVSGQPPIQSVRLLQLFGSYLVDVPVTAAKTFRFMSLECGTYLLIAMSGNQCLGTEVVTATVPGAHVHLKPADATANRCSSLPP